MSITKFFTFSSIAIFFMACGGETKPSQLFEIQIAGNKNQLKQNETVSVAIKNKKEKSIDDITYYIDGQELPLANNKLKLMVPKLGNKVLSATISYDGTTTQVSKKIKVLAATPPEVYTYEVLNEYPHDINAFTQGLEFHNNILYEGTGHKGESVLRKIDYATGKVLKQIDLNKAYFGEGITILGNKIYQLTWQSGIGFIYDLNTFKKIDNFNYGNSKEGWGLTNDGKRLIKSDGTEKIWFLIPVTLTEEG